MTSIEAYKEFLLKLNKNDTNTKINVSKGEFVLIFNEHKRIWLSNQLDKNESSDKITDVEELLEIDEKLTIVEDLNDKTLFKLPNNYHKYISSYSIASKGNCKNRILYNRPIKPKNINPVKKNENEVSSFDFEQAVVELSKGNLVVRKTDFLIDEQFLTYYREPIDIDIEGYIKINGTRSTTIDPDISDESVLEIINRCVIEATANYESIEQFQLASQKQ